MIGKLSLASAIFFSLLACVSEPAQTEQIKTAIMRYNQLLMEGYQKLSMNPLQEVATKEQAEKAYYHMAALGEGGMRMESKLKKIDYQEIKFPSQDEVCVTTREIWDFSHNDLRTGEKKYEQKDFAYLTKYELKREGNRWMIQKINAVEGDPAKKTEPPKWFSTRRPVSPPPRVPN